MSDTLRFLILAVVIGVAVDAFAAAAPDEPETPSQTLTPLKVTVREVTGLAQRMLPGDPPKWEPIQAGQKLDENTVIRTGFRTRVVLAFADNSVVVVERVTKMGIGEFRKAGNVTRTRLGLKYGSMRASVDKAAGPNDFTVVTPVATLAVTGTSGDIRFHGDAGLALHGTSGTWNVASGNRETNVAAGERTDGQLTPSIQIAQNSRDPRMVDVAGLSDSERRHLLQNAAGRGIFSFTQGNFLPISNTPESLATSNETQGHSLVQK